MCQRNDTLMTNKGLGYLLMSVCVALLYCHVLIHLVPLVSPKKIFFFPKVMNLILNVSTKYKITHSVVLLTVSVSIHVVYALWV